jgi:hypothetical protein
MHPALQTAMQRKCPTCHEPKVAGQPFCSLCMALLAKYDSKLYFRLRNSTGRLYDDYWMDARDSILKARENVAIHGGKR